MSETPPHPSSIVEVTTPGIVNAPPVVAVRRAVEFLCVIGVVFYTIMVCLQVFYRYALNSSLVWSEEVVQFVLLWTVMLGSAVATDQGAHIVLNPLDDRLSLRGRRIRSAVAEVCSIVFCAALFWTGCQLVWRTRIMTSSAADIPMYVVYLSMPVGAALIIFFSTVHAIAGTVHHIDPMEDRS